VTISCAKNGNNLCFLQAWSTVLRQPLLDIRDDALSAITKVIYFYCYCDDDGDDDADDADYYYYYFPDVLGSHEVFCRCGYADVIGTGLSGTVDQRVIDVTPPEWT